MSGPGTTRSVELYTGYKPPGTGGSEDEMRETIVDTAMLGASKAGQIQLHAGRAAHGRRQRRIRPPSVPSYEDCSSFATWCYWTANAPDPNGRGI